MTYKDSIPVLEKMFEKYKFTTEEKEAMRNVWYTVKQKAKEEMMKPETLYWVGNYFFHDRAAAVHFADTRNAKFILEKHQDGHGNMTTKKYIVMKGKILSVGDVKPE